MRQILQEALIVFRLACLHFAEFELLRYLDLKVLIHDVYTSISIPIRIRVCINV